MPMSQKSRLRDHAQNGHFTRPGPTGNSPRPDSRHFTRPGPKREYYAPCPTMDCYDRMFLSALRIGMNSDESTLVGNPKETAQKITIREPRICSPNKASTSAGSWLRSSPCQDSSRIWNLTYRYTPTQRRATRYRKGSPTGDMGDIV